MSFAQKAVDAAFRMFGVDGQYVQQGVGTPVPVRLLEKRGDGVIEWSGSNHNTETHVAEVRVSEVEKVKKNDEFVIDAETFKVINDPKRDSDRLVWVGIELNKK